MTDSQRAIVANTLLMFARKHGWEQLSPDEQELAHWAKIRQTHSRYMDLYVQSSPTAL